MAAMPPPASPTIEAIWQAREAAQESGYRDHLGASIIGTECERALWYSFRWATRARHTGRLLRLFETGQLAEARFVADLRAAGVAVLEVDPETGRQWSVRADNGHFGGSMDGVGLGFLEAPKTWHLVEFKTHSAKSFARLVKDGVMTSKPLHYAQMQVYMHLAGLTRAFYLACNKDTDDLYSERIKYDAEFAMRLTAKADRIVFAPRPPVGISLDPSWWQCRFCDHNEVCHGRRMPERHCRSCAHVTPQHGGTWLCERHSVSPDRGQQEAGCEDHRYIPELVPGRQVDVVGDDIVYRLPGEIKWIDRGDNAYPIA